jgi:hypothetical protein
MQPHIPLTIAVGKQIFMCFYSEAFLVMQVLWLGNWDKMKLENKDTKEVWETSWTVTTLKT